jgi:hypothetical protein
VAAAGRDDDHGGNDDNYGDENNGSNVISNDINDNYNGQR